MNANSTEVEVLTSKVKNIEIIDDFSCLTDAYVVTNVLESMSPGGAYSWDIDTWSQLFNFFFEQCDSGADILGI